MELPVGLKLPGLKEVETEEALFEALTAAPRDLMHFFEEACRDISWCAEHRSLIGKLARWLTEQFMKDRLAIDLAERAVEAVRGAHEAVLRQLPKDIRVTVGGTSLETNSLLFGMGSGYLHDLLRRECIAGGKSEIEMEAGSPETLQDVLEYLETGKIENLWRKDQTMILQEFEEAAQWELQGVMRLCVGILKRYINRANVKKLLRLAHDGGWQELFEECQIFLNSDHFGIQFIPAPLPAVSIEIREYRDEGVDLLREFSSIITHLHFSGRSAYEPEFRELMRRCSALASLDISWLERESEYFSELPSSLEELDLSMSPWLSDKAVEKILERCPNLKSLHLGSNSQISYNGLVQLHYLKQLTALGVPRCRQIGDEELLIILQSCPRLQRLNLAECEQISETGFETIADSLPELAALNLSHTNAGDGSLVAIAEGCKNLQSLNVEDCPNITEAGIAAARRLASPELQF